MAGRLKESENREIAEICEEQDPFGYEWLLNEDEKSMPT